MTIRLAIVGLGKIATDQHLPALDANRDFTLVATVDPRLSTDVNATPATFDSLDALIESGLAVDAISLAVPPQRRHGLAARALANGWHVMLEKPPGITLSEVHDLQARARTHGTTIYASWHSRHAPGVEAARDWLADKRITRVAIDWREDVTVFHPGQAWIWQPGGLGVFDPGINALSIVTTILPVPFSLQKARLDVPENCDTPIAAELSFVTADDAPMSAIMDFRHTGEPAWNIHIGTEAGELVLSEGGAVMTIDDETRIAEPKDEYAGVYARFARLIGDAESDVDLSPFQHVADAFLLGDRRRVAAFHE
ncbi:Gfo/Idh/MocA family protein [Salinisphaera sp. Q1T1-3]|uniref:Gfo/Idh/MocA family protein n=1 Tax=Salinisphaera sp. Q1T1-3 TaxID=2321229 RepID=UPI000E754699|nr:Gfo/Idh/MocA family oxidoreductase [Salinisphaera sp. Q1T1-3]RJS93024.1 gfo/Idh/MocA family oxidoreductase [Salinisphaera sp. Q1T1-3]